VLESYEPPRLSARVRRLLLALNVTDGAAVVAVGAVPALVPARAGQGALLGLTAPSVCLARGLGALVRRSLGALTVEVVGMGRMLSSTPGSAACRVGEPRSASWLPPLGGSALRVDG